MTAKDEKTSQKVTMRLDVYNEVRDAVAYFREHPELAEPRSIGALLEQAAVRELARLRDEHHRGRRWPRREGPLPVGPLVQHTTTPRKPSAPGTP